MRFYIFFFCLLFFSCKEEYSNKKVELVLADSLLSKANHFLDNNQLDSSFVYFDIASDQYLQKGDSLSAANCIIQMAITLFYEGDFYGAQEMSLGANSLLDTLNTAHFNYLAPNYNNLGNAVSAVGDIDNALKFYDLAIQFAMDSIAIGVYTNNKAVTLYEAKKYNEAYLIYKRNLDRQIANEKEYARILSNYSNLKWRIDSTYKALPDLWKSLKLREDNNDLWGKNSSYGHLFAYYLKHNNLDSALFYAQKSYSSAVELNSADDKLKALGRLIRVNSSDSVKHYFARYKSLEDSVQMSRLKSKNQYALIRYEVEKNKTENLKLHAEVMTKNLKVSRQQIFLVFVFFTLLIGGSCLVVWIKRRKMRLELEANNLIKENQLKMSRKVHDVVANGIYRVMSEIENKIELDKEELLDSLELMYEKSRDISYDNEPQEISFFKSITSLLKSFSSADIKVFIIGNDEAFWDSVSTLYQKEIFIICQELMINMAKHSQATEVVLRFEFVNQQFSLVYRDNGLGFEKKYFGNGLTNTVSRIDRINGTINFESEKNKGLIIHIIIPLQQ